MHYVCSDIHGQGALYDRLLNTLDLKPDDTLYILGDVIDRGPESIRILEDTAKRENVELFLGNHELMMLDYMNGISNWGDSWLYPGNGGAWTLRDFEKLPAEKQDELLQYIQSLWIQKYVEVNGTKYALHHSYFVPEKAGQDIRYSDIPDFDTVFDAVWYSPWKESMPVEIEKYQDGYVHVMGHYPVKFIKESKQNTPPYKEGPCINIDGCCAGIRYREKHCGLYCMSLETEAGKPVKEFWLTP